MSNDVACARAETVLGAAAVRRAVEMMAAEAGSLSTSAGPWSRNAASVLRTVNHLVSERAPGFVACSTFTQWFELERLVVIADWHRQDITSRNGCSPFCGKIVHDLLVQLAGGEDPVRDAHAQQLLERQFAAVATLLKPLAERMDGEILNVRSSDAREGERKEELEEAMASLDAIVGPLAAQQPRGQRLRALGVRVRTLAIACGRALHPVALRRSLAQLLSASAHFGRTQAAGIRSELSRSVRPPVHVEVLKDFGISLRRAPRHGGGVTLVPIRNASGNETLGTLVKPDGRGKFDVQIYADGSMLPTARGASIEGQRWVRWELSGVQDAETAEHVAAKIQSAMVRSVGGGRSMWPAALAAGVAGIALVGVLAAGTRSGSEPAAPQAAAQAPASARSDSALAALFDYSNNGRGMDEQIKAQILAGAGMAPPVEGETDPWVAQVVAGAAQAAQQANYEAGVPGVPQEDPAMKSFGLGLAPAGCDPSLRFKVAE